MNISRKTLWLLFIFQFSIDNIVSLIFSNMFVISVEKERKKKGKVENCKMWDVRNDGDVDKAFQFEN